MTMTTLEAAARRKTQPRRRPGIRVLRSALPGLAAAVLLAIVVQTFLRANETRQAGVAPVGSALRMENPRFAGIMKDGRTFLITATGAVRDTVDPNRVALDAPHLTRGVGTATPTQVISQNGVYDEAKGLLALSGKVQINNGDGYAFSTEQALIDTRTGEVVGNAGVRGTGVSGDRIQADSYSVSDKGDRVVFKGRVKTRLNPGQ